MVYVRQEGREASESVGPKVTQIQRRGQINSDGYLDIQQDPTPEESNSADWFISRERERERRRLAEEASRYDKTKSTKLEKTEKKRDEDDRSRKVLLTRCHPTHHSLPISPLLVFSAEIYAWLVAEG